MVAVTQHERGGPIHMCLLPRGVVAQLLVAYAIAVALVACFVHDVESIAVAEFVDECGVGIDGGAQEVDVGLFHQSDVELAGGIIDIAPHAWVVVVAIDTTELDIPAVDLKHLANDVYAFDAEMVVEVFDGLSVAVAQFHGEGI